MTKLATKQQLAEKRDAVIKELVTNPDYERLCSGIGNHHPIPNHYYVTGLQMGNPPLVGYAGYCVQIRKRCGAYGSDIVLMRCPDGSLRSYENMWFHEVTGEQLEKLKSVFAEGISPELTEDYTQPYSIGGQFPEVGAVVEPTETQSQFISAPSVAITKESADGSKSVLVV